jgi:Holliday junction resolvase RusA-like endonuclease
MMQFFLSMNPPTKTQQEHRVGVSKNGKPFIYEDRELKEVRNKLYKALAKFTPEKPYDKAVRLIVKWRFPR